MKFGIIAVWQHHMTNRMRGFLKPQFLLHSEEFWLERMSSVLITGIVLALLVQDCPAANVALDKPATASALSSTQVPGRAVDGDVNTHWSAPSHGSPGAPHWLKVDLEKVIPIYRITLVGPSSGIYTGYTLLYELYCSIDDTNWTQLASGTLVDTTDPIDMVYPGGRGIRYIRYDVVGGTHWAHLYELEAYPTVTLTGITLTNGSVQVTLSNCLSDVTYVIERAFDLVASNSWTAVANLIGVGTSPQWSEAISNNWTSVFYRVTTLQGPTP